MKEIDILLEGTMTASEVSAIAKNESVAYTPIAPNRIFILRGIIVYNGNAAAKYGNVKVGNTLIIGDDQIPAKKTLISTNMDLPVYPGEYVKVKGESAGDIQYRIWGIEIDQFRQDASE